MLLDGDTIIVPAAPIAATYTLTGPGIRNPAEYPLPNGQPISLAAAIGKAGGLSDRAKINEVQIIRTNAKTGQSDHQTGCQATRKSRAAIWCRPGTTSRSIRAAPPSRVDPFQILLALPSLSSASSTIRRDTV